MFERAKLRLLEKANKVLDRMLPQAYLDHRFYEASRTISNVDAGSDPDDYLYRRLTGNRKRDSTPLVHVSHYRHVQIARWLMKTKSFAWELLKTETAFLLGEGIKIQAKNTKVQKIIDEFWNDDVNNLAIGFADEAQEFSITGELHFPVQVNPINGFVQLGYMIPEYVQWIRQDPRNQRADQYVVIRDGILSDDYLPETYRIKTCVRKDMDPQSRTYGYRVGDTLLFKRNNLKNEARGWSDFLQISDWLHLHDQLLFARGIKQAHLNNYFYQVKVKEYSAGGLANRKAEIQREGPPAIGDVRVVPWDGEEWTPITPNMNAKDNNIDLGEIKLHTAAGLNHAPEWHGMGQDVNKATAKVTNPIYLRSLEFKQTWLRFIVRRLVDFVIDQAIIAGRLGKTVNRTVDIITPDLNASDILNFSKALDRFVTGLLGAVDAGFISQESAMNVNAIFFRQFGYEMSLAEEKDRIAAEEKEYADKLAKNPALAAGDPNADQKSTLPTIKQLARFTPRTQRQKDTEPKGAAGGGGGAGGE